MPSSSPLQTVRRFACSRDESASPAVLFPCRFPPGSIRPHPSTPRVAPAPPPREKPPTRLPLQTLPARSLPQSKTVPLSLPTPRTTPASANNRRLLREWPAPHLARCHTPSTKLPASPADIPAHLASLAVRRHRPYACRSLPAPPAASEILPMHRLHRPPFVPAIPAAGNSLPAPRTWPVRRQRSAHFSCSRPCHRQKQRECRTMLRFALHSNLAAMLFHHFFADGKPQPRTPRRSRKTGIINFLQ